MKSGVWTRGDFREVRARHASICRPRAQVKVASVVLVQVYIVPNVGPVGVQRTYTEMPQTEPDRMADFKPTIAGYVRDRQPELNERKTFCE